MATLRTDKKSPYYFATWRDVDGTQHTKSTKVRHTPEKGGRGKAESKNQLLARAQLVADAFEQASKGDVTGRHVRAAIESLSDTSHKIAIPSMCDYAQDWLNEREELGIKTINSDKRALRMAEKHLGEDYKGEINRITRKQIQALVIEECARVSASTVSRYMQSLSCLFNAAISDELMKTNPCRGLKYPKSGQPDTIKREAFTREDIKTLIEKLPPEWSSMVIVSLHLGGQRLGDCALLKWQDVDFSRACVGIVTQKTKRAHAIPMTSTLEAHLKERYKDKSGEYVHPELAERVRFEDSTSHISSEFANLCEILGISKKQPRRAGERRSFRDKTFHSLRASAVTMLHDAGVPLSMAMLIVGHNNADIHRVYYRPSDDAIRDSLSNLDI